MSVLLGLAGHAGAQEAPAPKVEPPDVFARVALVRAELERIRWEMGRPTNERQEIAVENAAPREVYYQALTLFSKADRLCFEQTRQRSQAPERPESIIEPADVLRVVSAALEPLRRTKAQLGIADAGQEPERDPTRTPTDVFRSIVQANRQLNLLLEQRFAPSDAFQQVTLAVGHASALLATFPEATRIAAAPRFQRGKRPTDVYRRLVACFDLVRQVARDSGLSMLNLEVDAATLDDVTPSDVFDIASLLVSELAYLNDLHPRAPPAREAYYPGRKLPSHVYQRAGILERQLLELRAQAGRHSRWLNPPAR